MVALGWIMTFSGLALAGFVSELAMALSSALVWTEMGSQLDRLCSELGVTGLGWVGL